MQREKKERNNLIIEKLKKGELKVDIAKEFNITPQMVFKIAKRVGLIKKHPIYNEKKCELCGKVFLPSMGNQRFCGSEKEKIGCAYKHGKKRNSELAKQKRKENPELYLKQIMEWRQKNPEKVKKISQKCRNKKRLLVLKYYSNNKLECNCCSEKEIKFLSIDHINGGGTQHLKKIKMSLVDWLIKNNYPKGFQVLCYNCNMAKGIYGKCPHKWIKKVAEPSGNSEQKPKTKI
jgi:hypothetical protein